MNPGAKVFSEAELAAIAELVVALDAYAICDEVYEHIVFDGRRHESVLRHPELAARAFVVSSFGKTYHCTGWKIGYCIAPPALTAELRKVHQYNSFCSFAPAQFAFAQMIEAHPEHYDDLGAFYQAKRDHFAVQLSRTKLKALPVPGGYFQLVDYSAVSDLADLPFCRWLTVEKGVAAIPLSPFYESPPPGQRLARLCFAKAEATLDAAISRLMRL
jgi:methionine aminotransferase